MSDVIPMNKRKPLCVNSSSHSQEFVFSFPYSNEQNSPVPQTMLAEMSAEYRGKNMTVDMIVFKL